MITLNHEHHTLSRLAKLLLGHILEDLARTAGSVVVPGVPDAAPSEFLAQDFASTYQTAQSLTPLSEKDTRVLLTALDVADFHLTDVCDELEILAFRLHKDLEWARTAPGKA